MVIAERSKFWPILTTPHPQVYKQTYSTAVSILLIEQLSEYILDNVSFVLYKPRDFHMKLLPRAFVTWGSFACFFNRVGLELDLSGSEILEAACGLSSQVASNNNLSLMYVSGRMICMWCGRVGRGCMV
jgi:hypothetical protein